MKCSYQNQEILSHLLDAQIKLNQKRIQLEEIFGSEVLYLDAVMDDILDAALTTVGIDKYSPLADMFLDVFFDCVSEDMKQQTLEKLLAM